MPPDASVTSVAPGSALISNTMVCEASRLLLANFSENTSFGLNENDSVFAYDAWERAYVIPLLDLLSLIEAVVLHDRLYTLPCMISDDAVRLQFRMLLIQKGILKELDTSPFDATISRLIVNGLSGVENPVSFAPESIPIDFRAKLKPEVEAFLQTKEEAPYRPALGGLETDGLQATSFQAFGKALIEYMNYGHSGAYESCTSLLRDMYYIFAAEAVQIPYWPQYGRIEFSKAFPNYFDKATRTTLYQKLAEAFQTAVAEIQREFEETTILIPPFSALALERSRDPEDLMNQVLDLRDEFSGSRQRLASLEEEKRQAKTIKQRSEFLKERATLLAELSTSFAQPNSLKYQDVVRYIPELVKPILKPASPASYSANLFLQPIEWIRNWWRKRPISMFFDARDKILKIEHYHELIAKVFSPQISQKVLKFKSFPKQFQEYASHRPA